MCRRPEQRGQEGQALGRSRGGFTTKIHAKRRHGASQGCSRSSVPTYRVPCGQLPCRRSQSTERPKSAVCPTLLPMQGMTLNVSKNRSKAVGRALGSCVVRHYTAIVLPL